MNRQELFKNIIDKKSYLCVGLDPDIMKMPKPFQQRKDGVFEFCKMVIEATKDYCVAYKPNLAFFESLGPQGWTILERIMEEIPDDLFTIADAKRGDIGNTSSMYAKAFFEYFNFDAVTVAPYMGEDSIRPFLDFEDKWTIVLGLTSNKGSNDFQKRNINSCFLYEEVIQKCMEWGTPDQMMFVIGATHPDEFKAVRELAKEYFFLVPGVGAQGGDLGVVSKLGMNDSCGLLVNSSRGIIYAGNDENYLEAISDAAKKLSNQMKEYL